MSSQQQHVVGVDVNLDEDRVVLDVVQRVDQLQVAELLRSERRVAVAERPTQERLVLLADVRLDAVGDVATSRDVVALVDERESDAVAERPRQQRVVISAADADKQRQVAPSTCKSDDCLQTSHENEDIHSLLPSPYGHRDTAIL